MSKRLIAIVTALTLLGAGCDMTGAPPPVSLIKASGPAVYYYADGKRYAYPNESVFFSWGESFDDVKTVSDGALASIPLSGLVTHQVGTLIKIQTDPKVYVVDSLNNIRWIWSEDLAIGLFGGDWATKVYDVSDTLFTGYRIGEPILSAMDKVNFTNKLSSYRTFLFDARAEARKDDSKAFPRMGSFTDLNYAQFMYTATTTASESAIWSWTDSVMSGWSKQYDFVTSDASSTSLVKTYSKTVGESITHRVVAVNTETGKDVKEVYFYELPYPKSFPVYPRSATNGYVKLDVDVQQMFATEDDADTVLGWYNAVATANGWSMKETGTQEQISRYAVYENSVLQRRMTVAFLEFISSTGTNVFATTYGVSIPE